MISSRILLASAVVVALAASIGAVSDVVQTTDGPVRGTIYDTYRRFAGIPFAQPPVGDLRWANPQPPMPWTDVLNAIELPLSCPQICVLPPFLCPNATSEDCLYLNVFTPLDVSTPKPVMVFIAGGAFFQGTGSSLLYSGEFMSGVGDVVLVTANYRLSALGYLVFDGGVNGNFGFRDQIATLEWVQANIANFGGDPTQVTLFGESAGGMSTSLALVSTVDTTNLFQRAIVESNPFGIPWATMEEATTLGKSLAYKVGCGETDLACMRQVSADDIIKVSDFYMPIPIPISLWVAVPFAPVIDGDLVTNQSISLYEEGKFRKVPLMQGTNNNEGVMFVYEAMPSLNRLEFDAALDGIWGHWGPTIGKLYPLNNTITDYRVVLSKVVTDYGFACPSAKAAQINAATGEPTYLYHFDHVLSYGVDAWGKNFDFCDGVVCHGSELPFVFQSAVLDGFAPTPEEVLLAHQMMDYWVSFASSPDANPNANVTGWNRVEWPAYTAQTLKNIRLATPVSAEDSYLGEYCPTWNEIGYVY